jgi:hypothetical protein
MKTPTFALLALAACLFGTGATSHGVLPDAAVVTARPVVVLAGGEVTVSAACGAGEIVTASLVNTRSSVVCGPESVVEILITAPVTAGYFEGPVTGSANGALGSFNVTVPRHLEVDSVFGDVLTPGTSGSTIATLAVGFFVVGAVLSGLTLLRRRRSADLLSH